MLERIDRNGIFRFPEQTIPCVSVFFVDVPLEQQVLHYSPTQAICRFLSAFLPVGYHMIRTIPALFESMDGARNMGQIST